MKQLHEYYDELHPKVKEGEQLGEEKENPSVALTVDTSEWMLESVERLDTKPTQQYACKNCRSILFNSLDIRAHEKGKGNNAFKWTKRE